MTIREGRWRCPRCNRENLGRDMECQGCGDTRDDDVEFYLPEDEPEVSDEDLLAQARAGSDLLCEFCDASNPPDAEVCAGCGAPLTERRREEVFHPVAEEEPPQPTPPPVKRRRRLGRGLVLGCLGLVGLVVLGLLAGTLWRRDVSLTVTRVAWERGFEVEQLSTVTRTGWKGELPAGARPLSSRTAVRSHRQVQVGTETVTETERYQVQVGTEKVKVGTRDLGNGFFEDVYEERPVYETRTRDARVQRPAYEQQPVHDTEVSYEIDEWQRTRTARALGTDLEPRWPELAAGERERPGSRSERYQVFLRGEGGRRFSTEVSEREFSRFPVGSRHRAEVDAFGALHGLRRQRVEAGQ